jgi:hypothetical protein
VVWWKFTDVSEERVAAVFFFSFFWRWRNYISEDGNHNHRRENLKSHIFVRENSFIFLLLLSFGLNILLNALFSDTHLRLVSIRYRRAEGKYHGTHLPLSHRNSTETNRRTKTTEMTQGCHRKTCEAQKQILTKPAWSKRGEIGFAPDPHPHPFSVRSFAIL